MRDSATFRSTVIGTFRERALRTAVIIDDQFPTYADVLSDPDYRNKFKESDRALTLYNLFRSRKMPCDVENKITAEQADAVDMLDIDHIQKSDLIILDWQLTPGSPDPSMAIRLIQRLSETKHFNTIVLYTREPDLTNIWIEIASSLRGGWQDPEKLLGNTPELYFALEDLISSVEIPTPPREVINSYIVKGKPEGLKGESAISYRKDLVDIGVKQEHCTSIMEALLHREIIKRLRDDGASIDGPPKTVCGPTRTAAPNWLQCGNCFLTIVHKAQPTADTNFGFDPDHIFDSLDAALLEWEPGYLTILVSELQNLMELEALATEEEHLRDPEVQTGLSYYLLQSIPGDIDVTNPDQLKPAVEAILDRVLEGVRRRISVDDDLVKRAAALLSDELQSLEWNGLKRPALDRALYNNAVSITRPHIKTKMEDVVFTLNRFLSTEPFFSSNITTGSIIRLKDKPEYWLCMSPACDMTSREPGKQQFWANQIHPLRAIIVIKLFEENSRDSCLHFAEHGKHIFIDHDERRAFRITYDSTLQPSYEVVFAKNAGGVAWDSVDWIHTFQAYRVVPNTEALALHDFEVVGQLRSNYASRLLQ